MEIRFPQDFIIYMDMSVILNGPFPSNGCEIDCNHDRCAHKEWWNYSSSNIRMLPKFFNLRGNII